MAGVAGMCVGGYLMLEFFPGEPPLQARLQALLLLPCPACCPCCTLHLFPNCHRVNLALHSRARYG